MFVARCAAIIVGVAVAAPSAAIKNTCDLITKNDNLAALGSLVAQVHGYGDAAPDIRVHAANITPASSRGSGNRSPRRSMLDTGGPCV